MPTLTKSGRVVIAESIAERPIFFAWGAGDGAWTTTPLPEDIDATALMAEIGRRAADQISYVVPDAGGSIALPSGVFSPSVTPTRHLYVRTKFNSGDAPSSIIRELGVFVGTELQPGLPPGQTYFLPGDVAAPGRLLHIEHFQPIYRSASIEESFEVIITF